MAGWLAGWRDRWVGSQGKSIDNDFFYKPTNMYRLTLARTINGVLIQAY